jgi:hypothetical protein
MRTNARKVAQNRAKSGFSKTQIIMRYQWFGRWLGREDSNLRMAESKSAALPLGYAPKPAGDQDRAGYSGLTAADQRSSPRN